MGNFIGNARILPEMITLTLAQEIKLSLRNCDQDKMSSYQINTISNRQVMRIKKNISQGIIS